jgi:glutathione synthase/RimK-type ligase-like ATP-grasp enzyme
MKDKLKVGLWIPPRHDMTASITLKHPAHVDARIYTLFLEYLDQKNIDYFEDLDFRKAIIKNQQVFIGDFCLSELDYFVWIGMLDRSRDSYHLEVLRVLEMSIKVYHSFSFYHLATDKFSAFSALYAHGIPLPELYLVSPDNLHLLEPLFEKDSFLLKPRRSAFGQGIVKLDSFEQFRDTAEYHRQKHYYLERFYENDLNEWTGVTVMNGTVLYGFRKKNSKISGWKVYDKENIGGDIIYVKPNDEIIAIAIKIGEILGGTCFGLDFIKTTEGYKVVDINCSPGIYYDLIRPLNIPIAELFFKMIF